MKEITKKSVACFLQGKEFSKSNTKVKVLATEKGVPCWIELLLFDNCIATLYTNERVRTLEINNCGYFTNTTKERLNGLPNVYIHQENYVWYLNGQKWNGETKKINLKETI